MSAATMTTGTTTEELQNFVLLSHPESDSGLPLAIAEEYSLIANKTHFRSFLVSDYLPKLEQFFLAKKVKLDAALAEAEATINKTDIKKYKKILNDMTVAADMIETAKKHVVDTMQKAKSSDKPTTNIIRPQPTTPATTPWTDDDQTVLSKTYINTQLPRLSSQISTPNVGESPWSTVNPRSEPATPLDVSPDQIQQKRSSIKGKEIAEKQKNDLTRNEKNLDHTQEALDTIDISRDMFNSYVPLFPLTNPVEYLHGFTQLQEDVTRGYLSVNKRLMSNAERIVADNTLRQFVLQAKDHYNKLVEAKQEKEKYTKGIRGWVRGLLNNQAKQRALEASTIGDSGLSLWRETCERMEKKINL
jgi:hypothetical protein